MEFLPIYYDYEELLKEVEGLTSFKEVYEELDNTVTIERRDFNQELLFSGTQKKGVNIKIHCFYHKDKEVTFFFDYKGRLEKKIVGKLSDPKGFIETYKDNNIVSKKSMNRVLKLNL